MNKLDELFKEKLTDYAVTPSTGSWEKVEAGLSKKNSTVIWLRWAAALLVGALLLGSLWLQRKEAPPQFVIEKQSPPPKDSEIQKQVQPIAGQKTALPTIIRKKKGIAPTDQSVPQTVILNEETIQVTEEQSVPSIQMEETPVAEIVKTSPAVAKSIVLTYTLGPVEAPAEEELAEAVSDKKDNSLKRMVDFAKNVKNGDSPMGGIRVMKEDLFAFDLKKKTTTSKNH